jgi:hypothetical protein
MEKLYEIYANDKLWDETSCPFGTQVLNREAYMPIERSELDVYELCEQLTAVNIEFVQSEKHLYVDMSWEDENEPSDHLIETTIYSYKGYVYHVKMCHSGVAGFTMTREPQFNKKYL